MWLKRLDGPMPHIVPPTNQVVTQREKTFLPHVLAVPIGTTVQFRNGDRIYHTNRELFPLGGHFMRLTGPQGETFDAVAASARSE